MKESNALSIAFSTLLFLVVLRRFLGGAVEIMLCVQMLIGVTQITYMCVYAMEYKCVHVHLYLSVVCVCTCVHA